MSNFNHGRSTYDFSRTKFSKVDLPIIPSQANPNMSGPIDADRNNLLRNYVSYIDYIKFGYLQQFGSEKYPDTYVRGNENDGNGREITWASFVEILDVIVKDLYDRIYALENNQDVPSRTYTITYDANGGNTTPAQQSVTSGTTVTLAAAITKNSDALNTYTFAGWVDQNTGITYTAGQEITVTSNITLKAKWDATPISETVYYWYVGTTKPTSLSQAQTVTSYPAEQTFTNPSITEKCYVYTLTNSNKTVNFYDPADPTDALLKAEDTTTINGYKITYISADGSTPFKIAKGGNIIIRIS